MNKSLKGAYDILPVFLQNTVLTSFGVLQHRERYGNGFAQAQALLEKSQWYSLSDLAAYQDEMLRKLVAHAYQTVPYYRQLFDSRKLKPSDINSREDLTKLPVLSRRDIQENFDNLQSRAYPKNSLKIGHTSGTTGSPLSVCYDSGVVHMTYALMDRQYRWANATLWRFGDRIAVLRGNVIVPISQRRPPFWRHNHYHNQLLLSSFHLSPENMPLYVRKLRHFAPAVVDGYPSTVYLLARYLLSERQTLPVKAVITGSETLYDFQRTAIEEAFQCRVFDYFAAAERVVFATECDHHDGHHLSPEYGITEILDDRYQPLPAGRQGLLVGTSLHNFGMPLIRYITNDVSALKTHACACGRSLPLMEDVTTKAEDILALKDGRMISPSVLTHPFKPLRGVAQSQIIQEDYDQLTIKLVPNDLFRSTDTEHLMNEFKARLGADMRIDIEIVSELPRTKSGKFKWVVSKVDKGIKVPSG